MILEPIFCFAALLITAALNAKGVQGQHLHETEDVKPGETVRLNCSTKSLSSADWHYRKTKQGDTLSIYIGNSQGGGGSISNSYKSRTRYTVDVDIANGRYDLVIKNVTKSDEGIYTCSETTDPDSFTSTALTVLEETTEECPYDEAAITGEFVQLRFHSTQSDSIHVEHRSIDRSYPLHVFRDGKIVNDYYVLSGRFGFNRSDATWNLLMKDVQLSDAGTYITSEDNGMGKTYTTELIVIDKTVGFEIEGETCIDGEVFVNVTCSVYFSGYCPPRLQLRRAVDGHEGETKLLNSSVFVTSPTAVHLKTVVSGDDLAFKSHLFCTVTTPNSYIVLANWNQTPFTASDPDFCKENANKGSILAVVLPCLLLVIALVILALTAVFKFRKNKRRKTPAKGSTNQNLPPNSEEMKSRAPLRFPESTDLSKSEDRVLSNEETASSLL